CIPYKFKQIDRACEYNINQVVEVLVVTSQKKREEIMFPKVDITKEFTNVHLGNKYVSDRDAHFDLVKQINVAEAMAECKQSWMKEALDRLVKRLSTSNLEEMRSA
ncbi:hypothetical protein BHE74_00043824, partial [Ensete ventricosum]